MGNWETQNPRYSKSGKLKFQVIQNLGTSKFSLWKMIFLDSWTEIEVLAEL